MWLGLLDPKAQFEGRNDYQSAGGRFVVPDLFVFPTLARKLA